jgi:hypothetical protein
MPFKMMHAFETVYNKDTLPCLCFAKTGSVPNASAPWNIELVPPTAPSRPSTPAPDPSESAARAFHAFLGVYATPMRTEERDL